MNIKKFFKRLGLSVLGFIVFLIIVGAIMECTKKDDKPEIRIEKPAVQKEKTTIQKEESKSKEKLQLTQKQKDIIQEHYDLYNKLTANAKTGEDLDKASKEVTKQLCEKYKMTTKEYEAMWDIYNFGFITEENK